MSRIDTTLVTVSPWSVGSGGNTNTLVTLGAGSTVLLAANNLRVRVMIINLSIVNFVDFKTNGTAGTLGGGIRLGALGAGANAGMHYWDSGLGPVPSGGINAFGTAGQQVSVIEFFKTLL